jgi:hypothetical protein
MIYEIWSEGYAATGHSGTSWKIGEQEGRTFEEACLTYMLNHVNRDVSQHYNPKYNTYWGCKLFDNQIDASRSFG